jgi:cobalamin synthase
MSVPFVRRRLSEQQLILAALALTATVGVLVSFSGSIWAQPILALVVGNTSTGAKPAFDSIAQRNVPPAALGRAFARFETQLQLVWVVAAVIAVLVSSRLPFRAGDLIIAIACAVAAAFHLSMRHSWRRRASATGSAGDRAGDTPGRAGESGTRRSFRIEQPPDGRRPGQGASAGG